jgi:hypothetical protein
MSVNTPAPATYDVSYGGPVMRSPSVASSLASKYGEDQTDERVLALSADEFAEETIENLGLRRQSSQELLAEREPLIVLPHHDDPAERERAILGLFYP